MPSTSITEEKAALRRAVRARLSAMSPEERAESDGVLFRRFLALPGLAAADRVLLFCGMGTEPDTARLIPALLDRGKQVLLPRCLPGRGTALSLFLKPKRTLRRRRADHPAASGFLAKKATPAAPGPAWVPMAVPMWRHSGASSHRFWVRYRCRGSAALRWAV